MSFMPRAGFRDTTVTEIKKSRFLTTVARTDDEAEARTLIASVRSMYPDARHHCVAFVVDDDGQRQSRSSDDGEPAGTAGIPMLNALIGADLINITAVVTRYFGGIKLGAGGLTRAYGGCVSSAVAAIPRVEAQRRAVWSLNLPLAETGRIQEELLRGGATILRSQYDETGQHLSLTFPADLTATMARISQGRIMPIRDGDTVVEVPVD
ncbi:MAG: YigZ family protein [Propionibacteriaceae bacterium]|jgi:uncharacterized YigZ family protein|nr:YigZ family protein [Propionibacteriaceae bacterium]